MARVVYSWGMIPIEFIDVDDGRSGGWYAYPAVPRKGDEVVFLGMIRPMVVRKVRWVEKEVADTRSMREAGLYRPGGFESVVAQVFYH